MLGHNSAWMTLDIYADLFDSDPDHVSAAIDRAVNACGLDVGRMEDCGQKEKLKPLLSQRFQPVFVGGR